MLWNGKFQVFQHAESGKKYLKTAHKGKKKGVYLCRKRSI